MQQAQVQRKMSSRRPPAVAVVTAPVGVTLDRFYGGLANGRRGLVCDQTGGGLLHIEERTLSGTERASHRSFCLRPALLVRTFLSFTHPYLVPFFLPAFRIAFVCACSLFLLLGPRPPPCSIVRVVMGGTRMFHSCAIKHPNRKSTKGRRGNAKNACKAGQ